MKEERKSWRFDGGEQQAHRERTTDTVHAVPATKTLDLEGITVGIGMLFVGSKQVAHF